MKRIFQFIVVVTITASFASSCCTGNGAEECKCLLVNRLGCEYEHWGIHTYAGSLIKFKTGKDYSDYAYVTFAVNLPEDGKRAERPIKLHKGYYYYPQFPHNGWAIRCGFSPLTWDEADSINYSYWFTDSPYELLHLTDNLSKGSIELVPGQANPCLSKLYKVYYCETCEDSKENIFNGHELDTNRLNYLIDNNLLEKTRVNFFNY